MFKQTIKYKEIKQECADILNEKASFSCLVDGIIEYEFYDKEDLTKHLFKIIADDNFINQMTVLWLLELKRVSYFSHEIYLKNGDDFDLNGEKSFNIEYNEN